MKKYIYFIVGMAISSFGLFNIHSRCFLSEGGILGAMLLINHWFKISPSITSVIMDGCCFALGTLILGKQFLKDSLLCTCIFSLWYRLFEYIGPILPNLESKPLLASLFGGLFVGVGCGLVVSQGVAAGGDDALALVMNKCFGLSIARCYNITDFIVLTASLSYIPFNQIAYSLLSVIISSNVVQLICDIKKKYAIVL